MSNKLKKRRKWGITCHLRCFWGRRPGLISWKKLSVIIRILHLLRIFKRCKKKKKKKCLPLKVSHIINFKWYIGRQFFFTDLSNYARLKITPSSIIAFSFNYVRKTLIFQQMSISLVGSLPAFPFTELNVFVIMKSQFSEASSSATQFPEGLLKAECIQSLPGINLESPLK